MSETTDPRGRTAAEIESDVERTRARVSDTIEALRDSMSPNQIMDQVVDYARSSGGSEFIRNLGSSVRDNPLPVVLIGAGIGWLLMSQNRPPAAPAPAYPFPARKPDFQPPALPAPDNGPGLLDRAGAAVASARDAVADAASNAADAVTGTARSLSDSVADAAGSAGAAASSAAGSASSAAGSLHDAARRQMHDTSHAVSEGTSRAGATIQQGWGRMSREQPLLIGALGLAVGAALGALLPSTEAENRLMGEASDAVSKQVSDVAQEQYAQVKDTVAENVEQAKDALAGAYDEARENVSRDGLSAHSLGDGVKQAASRVAEAATRAGDALGDAAKDAVQNADAGDATPRDTAPRSTAQVDPAPAPQGLHTPNIVVPPKV